MKGVGKPQYYLGGDIVNLGEEWEKEGISMAFSAQTYIENILPKLLQLLGKENFENRQFRCPPNITPKWIIPLFYHPQKFLSTDP